MTRPLGLLSRLSIRWKFIVIILSIQTFALLLIGQGIYHNQRKSSEASLIRQLGILTEVIGSNTEAALAFKDAAAAEQTLKSLSENPHIRSGALYVDGQPFARYVRAGSITTPPDTPPVTDLLDVAGDRVGIARPVALQGRTLGTLYVESDTGELRALLKDLLAFSIGLYAAIFLLTFLIALRMQRWITTPIALLAETAEAVGQHKDFSLRAKKVTEDETGALTDRFNDMLGEIQQRDVEVREAQTGLERRVQERTKALAETTTQLQRSNQELQKVNLELDSFVYTASHDLRAPLRAIAAFAAFLEEDYRDKLDTQGQDYLKEIQLGTDRMNRLINDLLTLSRVSRIQNPFEHVNMQQVVRDVLERLDFELKAGRAALVLPPTWPIVFCDRIKIAEVFSNLLHNAMKFSSKSPTPPRIEIGWEEQPAAFQFFVRDNGIGVDPQYHEQIFGLFKRLHTQQEYEGTGAGLNIVKRIIEDHGGRVWVESRLGEGARFVFLLPKPAHPAEPPANVATPHPHQVLTEYNT